MCTTGSVRLLLGDGDYYYLNENVLPEHNFIKDKLARGRVELCINRTYGTVCDDSWDNQDASVACRQLEFSPYGESYSPNCMKGYLTTHACSYVITLHIYQLGSIAVRSQYFGEGTLPILINNINCSGTERSLLNCMHNTGGTCTTEMNDAGVVCQGLQSLLL